MSFIITYLNDREMVTEGGKDVLFVVSRREIRTKNISLHREAGARQEREGEKRNRDTIPKWAKSIMRFTLSPVSLTSVSVCGRK